MYEAVLLGDDQALRFALEYQDDLFPGLPLVFFGINDLSLAQEAVKNPLITGFYETDYLDQTVELALKLFPKTKILVALHDQSAAGSEDIKNFWKVREKFSDCAFINFDATFFSQDELILQLENLPKDSLLFYMTCYADKSGKVYSMLSRTNAIVNHTKVPIFRNYVGGEGMGILGGTAMNMEEQCAMAGKLVVDILNGKDISTVPLVLETSARTSFDYQLMKKYNLDFSLLPKDTIFYNEPNTFIKHYGKILPIAGLILLALLMVILIAYVGEIRAKRGLEEIMLSRNKLAESEELLRYQVEYDEVLDILNRRTITDRLRNTVAQDAKYAVVIVDIDGFKALNENYGHSLADSILQYLVALFKEMAAEGNWQIARYGGDEFLLYIPDKHLSVNSPEVQQILAGVRTPIPLGDETLAITASLGISNSDGITLPEQHLINAEIAMYEAKNHGRNGAALYDEEMKARAREEVMIKDRLQEAFEHDGFYMVYQPQINSRTKKVSGYEALVRMKAPGMYPGKFIPVAEHNGWIWRIGRITTELAIKQLAAWRDAGYELHPVSINFSGNQLNDHGYFDFVKGLLSQYDIPPHFVEIEITEGLFLEKSALADEIFKRFKEIGIRLLMDDFGTGYSSLGYLSYIPVDVIKLDKSLVDTYLVDGKDSFIRDIIRLMHDLDKEMIIEGVEEKWQFERLREFEADTIQGYYFSKPIPADEAITFTVGDDK
ncbi:MAG: GGDEF domain-containing protein [Treponema sp.]|nr:GGDEF domain-containing protein [Treponema sp.]